MSASSSTWIRPKLQLNHVLIGTVTMLVTVALAVWLTRGHAPSTEAVRNAVLVYAAGSLVVGLLFWSVTPYPRVSYVTSLALIVGSVLLTLPYATDAVRWKQYVGDQLWLTPWFLLMMHSAAPRVGTCAASGRLVRWMLPGTAALLGAIMHVPLLLGW